jgi:hypothetical protein
MDYLMTMCVEPGADESIVFEVERDQISDDLVLSSPRLSGAAVHASISLTEALRKLKPSLQRVIDLLHDLSPQRIDVEFGLKIGGETGIIVSKGTAEANLTVRMSWDPDNQHKGPNGRSRLA